MVCRSSSLRLHRATLLAKVLGLSTVAASPAFRSEFDAQGGVRVRTVSWNVAAVNNNPFEYWITHPNPAYKQLMESIEQFLIQPGEEDVRVQEVFTEAMFRRVLERMREVGLPELDFVTEAWESDYRHRRVVTQFLKDEMIGKKRLASMPDRITNTVHLVSGDVVFRPTVMNCYPKGLNSVDEWFEQWLSFFFETKVDVDGKGPKPIYSMLQKIKQAKYPAITSQEEAASTSLQVVIQGILDALLVTVIQQKSSSWQELRQDICNSLFRRKNHRILEILRTTYQHADVVFLQEVGNELADLLTDAYADSHTIVRPKDYDAKRNQNSIMVLRKDLVANPAEVEVPRTEWEAGDLLAVKGDIAGIPLTFASFHGDTNGLLTTSALNAMAEHKPTKGLLFGLDANAYEKESKGNLHARAFEQAYKRLGFSSCWDPLDPTKHTTFNARTYLQPQLNKAARSDQIAEKGDKNPKDFVLFSRHLEVVEAWRDNTGRGQFLPDIVFPSLDFPSDHAAIAVDLRLSSLETGQEL